MGWRCVNHSWPSTGCFVVDYCWYFCSFAFALLGRWLRPGSLLLKVPESAGGSKAEDHWSRVWDTGCLQLRAWVESNVAPFGVFVACQLYAKKTLQGRPYILAATWPSPPAQARPPHIQTQKPKCLDLGFWILDVVFLFWILDLGFWIGWVPVLFVAAPNGAVWILEFGFAAPTRVGGLMHVPWKHFAP